MLKIHVHDAKDHKRAIEVEIAANLPDLLDQLSDAVEAIDTRLAESGGKILQEQFRQMFVWGVLAGKFFDGVTPEDMERYGQMAAEQQKRMEDFLEAKEKGKVNDIVDALNSALETLKRSRADLKKAQEELTGGAEPAGTEKDNKDADKAIEDALREAHESAKKAKAEDDNATE